ncbi:MAG: metal-dependent hydrolase, partial [Thiobacillus sp.]|nr:metal-dependent hydrolase [Thiobacillus sp.]
AANLARHSAHGWDDAALPDDYREIGALLRMSPDQVVELVRTRPASARSSGAH